MSLFHASQHLYANVDEKDRGPADDLPVLAGNTLVAAWKLDKSGNPTHLLQVAPLTSLSPPPQTLCGTQQFCAIYILDDPSPS
jgi:hypothetical protein